MPEPISALVDIPIRFRDIDALGHVNNAVYFTYLETARVELWKRAGYLVTAGAWPFVIAEAHFVYKAPLFLGETARVQVRFDDIKRASFAFVYDVTEAGDGRVVGQGRTVQVAYDFEKKQVIAIPDDMRTVLLGERTA
jgi:acyl-CoA thioester hydrolase